MITDRDEVLQTNKILKIINFDGPIPKDLDDKLTDILKDWEEHPVSREEHLQRITGIDLHRF